MTQPGGYAGIAQTHGPTLAGAMEDFTYDEMPEASLDIVRRDGEPSQGLMNEGAWEDEGGGFPGACESYEHEARGTWTCPRCLSPKGETRRK